MTRGKHAGKEDIQTSSPKENKNNSNALSPLLFTGGAYLV